MSVDFLATAYLLAKASPKRPRQSDLKRAVSTAYYALFHAIAHDAANLLVGTGPEGAYKVWRQTYRALDHGNARNACGQLKKLGFPKNIMRLRRGVCRIAGTKAQSGLRSRPSREPGRSCHRDWTR